MLMGLAFGAAMAGPASAQSPDVKVGVDAWGRGDWRTAVDKWRPLAIGGDADAQFNLGQAYKLGRGVPENPAMAESWFRRAAIQGHDQAQANYGLALFQDGHRAEALPWLEKAAARGEPRAQLVLGTMLFNGDGVPRDMPRAYALVARASAANLPSASQTLAQMDGFITPADRQHGLELARRYESQVRLAAVDQSGMRPPERVDPNAAPVPPRTAPTPAPRPADPMKPRPAPPGTRPGGPKQGPIVPQESAAPARRATAGGGYRVQLGAFRDPGNARALWGRVGARVGGQPNYASAGGVTRLQAGPFPTRADAQRACAKAGVSCVVITP